VLESFDDAAIKKISDAIWQQGVTPSK
jgi:hypothetical protein